MRTALHNKGRAPGITEECGLFHKKPTCVQRLNESYSMGICWQRRQNGARSGGVVEHQQTRPRRSHRVEVDDQIRVPEKLLDLAGSTNLVGISPSAGQPVCRPEAVHVLVDEAPGLRLARASRAEAIGVGDQKCHPPADEILAVREDRPEPSETAGLIPVQKRHNDRVRPGPPAVQAKRCRDVVDPRVKQCPRQRRHGL
jgi:hypothetical protein